MVARDVELTAAAMEAIGDYYAELRSESATGALPVTVRDCPLYALRQSVASDELGLA